MDDRRGRSHRHIVPGKAYTYRVVAIDTFGNRSEDAPLQLPDRSGK